MMATATVLGLHGVRGGAIGTHCWNQTPTIATIVVVIPTEADVAGLLLTVLPVHVLLVENVITMTKKRAPPCHLVVPLSSAKENDMKT